MLSQEIVARHISRERLKKEADHAATDLLERFDWMGLPHDTDQIEDLQTDLSNAIFIALEDWV